MEYIKQIKINNNDEEITFENPLIFTGTDWKIQGLNVHNSSIDFGESSSIDGNANFVEGYWNHVVGDWSHIEGFRNTIQNTLNTRTDLTSHVEGSNNNANGIYLHVEGYKNSATGQWSHVEGYGTQVNANNAHAEGYYTIASNDYEHSEGIFNKSNTGSTTSSQTIHSVGIGSSNNRANALEIMKNGDVYINRIGSYDGTNVLNSNSLQEVINNFAIINDPIELTTENLNDYNTNEDCGYYYAAGGNTVTNKPASIDSFGLVVYKIAQGLVIQLLFTGQSSDSRIFTRRHYGSWSSWIELNSWNSIQNKPIKVAEPYGWTDNEITTEQFLDLLEEKGLFGFGISRGSWSYAYNHIISDTGIGKIHLSGAAIQVIGNRNNCTITVITPTVDSSDNEIKRVFIYVNNGPTYFPGWFKLARYDELSNYLPLTGGTLSGSLTIANRYTISDYLDVLQISLPDGGSLELSNGEGYPNLQLRASGDDYTTVLTEHNFSELAGRNYLPLSGGTLTGPITIKHDMSGNTMTIDGSGYINTTTNFSVQIGDILALQYAVGFLHINGSKALTENNYSDYVTPSSIGAATESHTHSAANITSGTLALARIPTGTTSSTVALGNHTHSNYLPLTGGTITGDLNISDGTFIYKGDDVLTSGNFNEYFTITDTKNTTGTSNTTIKLYLVGGATQSSTGIVTYSNSSVYTQSGQLYATQMNATNGFYETSDARLKNFKDDIKALDVVSKIPTKYFTWKEDENQESQIGTSAQEVQKIYPELVSKTEDDTLTVDYAKLSIIALAAIKELKVEIQSLKEEIKQLKSK